MSSITWFFHRLRGMSLPELRYRIQQQFLRVQEQVGLQRPLSARLIPVNLNIFSFSREVPAFLKQNTRLQSEILKRAEAALQHRFKIFNTPVLDLGESIDWHRDYETGNRWPLKFYGKLSYRSRAAGSSKWIMELNRHQHFFWLGQAYLLTGEKKYADEILKQMQHWVDQNPYLQGIHWYSGLEMALRLIGWSWALGCVAPEIRDKNTLQPVFQSMLSQSEFISRHPVKYSSANNHLIGEAAGILVASFLFPGQRSGWFEIALETLTREIERQILPDGLGAEQSTHYLGFIIEFAIIACVLLLQHQQEIPEVILDRLDRAALTIHQLRDASGNLPAIGDGDDSIVFFQNVKFSNFDSLLNCIGILTGKSECCVGIWQNDLKTASLLRWHPNYKTFASTESKPRSAFKSRLLADSGYALLESESKPRQQLIFDGAPLGLPPLSAHGHTDALSILLTLDGTPVLIDPGTYSYYRQLSWKNYFRGTAAHNTIVVDGQDQSEIASHFVWRNQAQSKITCWQSEPCFDRVAAEHNGYQRLRKPVIHQRHLFYIRNSYWIVTDRLYGYGRHSFEQNFHFSATGKLKQQAALFIWEKKTTRLLVAPVWHETQARIYQASLNPIRGWISPLFHQKVPGQTLSFSKTASCPTKMSVILWPGNARQSLEKVETAEAQLLQGRDLSEIFDLKISTTSGTDFFIKTRTATDKVRFGDFEFEGELLWISLLPDQRIRQLIAINVKQLKQRQTEIFSFQENQPVYTIGFEQEQQT